MANPPPSPRHRQRAVRSQTDRLSILSDELLITILSLLPTRLAARTSLLCRRFQHLWKTCPSVYLSEDRTIDTTTFEAMATCAILRRQSSNPLVSLRLNYAFHLPYTFLCSLLVKAHSLGLQHLIVDGAGDDIESIMPTIFSIGSLLSLQLPTVTPGTLPSVVTLTLLKTLSLCLYDADSAEFNRLLAQLPSLEELRLMLVFTERFTLSSQTIRKLDLCFLDTPPQLEFVGLSMPLLEMFHFNGTLRANVPRIEGDMPSLIKAVIILDGLSKKDSTAVAQLLNCVSNVEELSLNITESSEEKYPFLILLEPGKDVPIFRNLKLLDANMCFHEQNFESIIALLRHTTALESLKLVHEAPHSYTFRRNRRKRNDWRSKLPRNAGGNHNYVHFTNLHLGQNSKEFMKVSKKCTSK